MTGEVSIRSEQPAPAEGADPQRRSRRGRVAVFGFFFVLGLALALWVVYIPAVQTALEIPHSLLGTLLLFLGLGLFTGMQVTGHLADRVGSRRMTAAAAVVLAAAVNLPGLAGEAWQLGVALFVFGFAYGALDVAMNGQAVLVERRYRRPITGAFHGMWSIGGGAGATLGAGLQAAGLDIRAALGAAAVACLAVVVLARSALVEPAGDAEYPQSGPESAAAPAPRLRGRIVTLAVLAFALLLAEGTATDWSALHAVEHLGVDRAAASLAYAAFATAMTIGRFSSDLVSNRVGPVHIVRGGSIVAAAGLAVVVASPFYAVTLLGWMVYGLRLLGIVPQIFTAAGNLSSARRGAVMALVVGTGRLGLLAGPALIGWIAQQTGLNLALLVPLLFCAVGVVLAARVAPRRRSVPV